MKLSHVKPGGLPWMVDVSGKEPTARTAVAKGLIRLSPEILTALENGELPKGDVAATAVVAGIQAVKRTSELIPMCHPLAVDSVDISLDLSDEGFHCTCSVSAVARTGFEMEALTGVSVTLLTVYDMLKAVDRGMIMDRVRLVKKTGGRSGTFTAAQGE